MNKKKGSVLVVVLGVLLSLSIVGIAVFTYVKSTSKNNSNTENKMRTEALAKSALNLSEFNLIEGKIKEGNISEDIKRELGDKVNDFELNVNVTKENKNRFRIDSEAVFNKSEYAAKETSYINIKKTEVKDDVELFLNSSAGITILGDGKIEWTYIAQQAITNTTININNYYGSANEYLKGKGNYTYNNKNMNREGALRSTGLNLKFKSGNINLNFENNEFEDGLKVATNNKKGTVVLLDGTNPIEVKNIESITSKDIKNNVGAIISLGGNAKLVLINGNLNIDQGIGSKENLFLYVKKKITTSINGTFLFKYCNIVSGNGIELGASTNIDGVFKTEQYKKDLIKYINKFI